MGASQDPPFFTSAMSTNNRDDDKKFNRRSQQWFGKLDKDGFAHRSWMKNQGYPNDLFDGSPVIGICNTWGEFNSCNSHFKEIAEWVKRGVYEAHRNGVRSCITATA